MNGRIGKWVRKAYGTGIKGVCDSKQPLTILFSQFLLS